MQRSDKATCVEAIGIETHADKTIDHVIA